MRSDRHVYIISDLHLGGAPSAPDDSGTLVDFQMCPPESRRRLARFIHFLRSKHSEEKTELVINGDFVDFLAEESLDGGVKELRKSSKFDAFTFNSAHVVFKLERIIRRVDQDAPAGNRLFEALQEFVCDGNKLVILLGNHDIELSFPEARRTLVSAITKGHPARFDFIYDGEAYRVGDLLVEHGNRYDGWNAIAYGVLRAYRSSLSRGESSQIRLTGPPGSSMVTQIMNPLKARFKFIDLLKPENEAMIPLLVALDPRVIGKLSEVFFLATRRPAFRKDGVAEDASYIAEDGHTGSPADHDWVQPSSITGDPIDPNVIERSKELLAQAAAEWSELEVDGEDMHIAAGGPSFSDTLRGGLAILSQALPFSDPTYQRIRKAFVAYRHTIGLTFDLTSEAPQYLEAASRLSEGRRIVVFGHTHLAKRIELAGGGIYLNSGTWCPTIRLPTDFYSPDAKDDTVFSAIKDFVEDLANNRIKRWATLQTTFVDITFDGTTATGDVFEFRDDGSLKNCRDEL
jgi:UDP-2,3-diacylglucosamine pyrophosphatase LpxH